MNSTPNIPDPDGFYRMLVAAHEGLSRECSERLNAALVVLLANQLGDQAVLVDCIDAARAAAGSPTATAGSARPSP